MITSRNAVRKKLEEGRRRRQQLENNNIEMDLYKKPLVRYLITVFSDGSIKADKLIPEEEEKEKEEKDSVEESK